MNLKDLNTKTGSISQYSGYLLILFLWGLTNEIYDTVLPETWVFASSLIPWLLKIIIGPILFCVVYAGIYDRQTKIDPAEPSPSFLSHIKHNIWRFLGANLVSILAYLAITLISALFFAGDDLNSDGSLRSLSIISGLISTLMLFWYSGLVIEPKLFRSLGHALKTLLTNPIALCIGLIWAAAVIADSFAFDLNEAAHPLPLDIARAAVFAVLKALAIIYILAIYQNLWGEQVKRVQAAEILTGRTQTSQGEGLAKVSLGFAIISVIPFMHLCALILGLVSLKRAQRFILKAAIAAWVGGFFTILYALLIAEFMVGSNHATALPDYTFLSGRSSELQPYVELLDQAEYATIIAQLDGAAEQQPARGWAYDAALALAKYEENDLDGALKSYYAALQKNPERGEFYIYYGLALLDNANIDMAKEQFQLAREHDPSLVVADRYLALLQNVVEPNLISSAAMYLVILFFLFTVHEYGHAFAAYKLGDDTAKNQGRLTLNPLVHLDLFGSVLIPAVLLLQQSSVFFGWARPVQVDKRNLKNPDKDDMLISFAGPAVNLMVAMVTMLLIIVVILLTRLLWPETLSLNLIEPSAASSLIGPPNAKLILGLVVFLRQLMYTSIILGILNLLPIPPLDGGHILVAYLPENLKAFFNSARQFTFLFFILLSLTPVFDYILGIPLGIAWIGLKLVISVVGLT